MSGNFLRSRSGLYVPMSTKPNGVHFGDYFFWAEYGQLNMVDKRHGRHHAWSPAVAMRRLKQIVKGIGRGTAPGYERDATERTLMMRQLQKVEDTIKEANEQAAKMPQLVPGLLLNA